MREPGQIYRFRVPRCGPVAHSFLESAAAGRIHATFRNSIYLESAGRLACVGNSSLGLGPLNAICEATTAIDWSATACRRGAPFHVANQTIRIGDRVAFAFDGAEIWDPGSAPDSIDTATLRLTLDALLDVARSLIPEDGLARLVLRPGPGSPETAIAARAREPIGALHGWLRDAVGAKDVAATEPFFARELVGLGPGLTPSGDDLLGGLMIALHATGHDDVHAQFWRTIAAHVKSSTNAISRAHLEAAATGLGSEAVHDILAHLLSGDRSSLRARLDAIDRIGHTSGWDALAGVYMGLRAIREASDAPVQATLPDARSSSMIVALR